VTARHGPRCPGHDPDDVEELPRRRPGALRGRPASESQLAAFEAALEARLATLQGHVAAVAKGERAGGVRTASGCLTSLRRGFDRLARERRYAAEQARRLGRRPGAAR
jgi:hypothetical protein